jgi:HSP20 family molecular chaperone IbpA
MDMDETDEDIRITAELPGVDKDNLVLRTARLAFVLRIDVS